MVHFFIVITQEVLVWNNPLSTRECDTNKKVTNSHLVVNKNYLIYNLDAGI